MPDWEYITLHWRIVFPFSLVLFTNVGISVVISMICTAILCTPGTKLGLNTTFSSILRSYNQESGPLQRNGSCKATDA
ncbi:hypothetical protein HDF11_004311 [Tunturiibacter psychrotolerans]